MFFVVVVKFFSIAKSKLYYTIESYKLFIINQEQVSKQNGVFALQVETKRESETSKQLNSDYTILKKSLPKKCRGYINKRGMLVWFVLSQLDYKLEMILT